MMFFKLALAIMGVYLMTESVVGAIAADETVELFMPSSTTTTETPESATAANETVKLPTTEAPESESGYVNVTEWQGTTTPWMSTTGNGNGANTYYLLCVIHFHHFITKSQKYIADLSHRIQCHETWIKHLDQRINDLGIIFRHLQFENAHLQHLIHLIHVHYIHLWHHYKAMRATNKQCREKRANC